jgi:hypothetical protein
VPAVPAPDGLSALKLHFTIAVAASIGDCARVDIDGRGVGRLRGLWCVAGHCEVRECLCRDLSGMEKGSFVGREIAGEGA